MNDVVINKAQSIQRCVARARQEREAGIPTDSAESFELLARAGIITTELAASLKKMVGFRNTVIHEYQVVDMGIVEAVIATGLDELVAFADTIVGREASA
jgi:uncharacterized protein YutE (UPF0331/DUF86 family)